MYLESKPSDSSRKISKSLCYECQVRGSFCERSEELDGMQYIPLFFQLSWGTWATVRRVLEIGASKMALSASRRYLTSTESTALEST